MDALFVHRGAFVADRGATLVLEPVQVIVEGRESRVVPMVLIAEAFHESDRRERGGLVRLAKVYVHTRELVVLADRREREAEQIYQASTISSRRGEKSTSRMRRERHTDDNFREVSETGALGRIGPSVIEHELAHAVSLEVERACGDDLFFGTLANDQMIGGPSGVPRRRAGILHRAQPIPFDERRVIGREQIVPRITGNFVDSLDDCNIEPWRSFIHGYSQNIRLIATEPINPDAL